MLGSAATNLVAVSMVFCWLFGLLVVLHQGLQRGDLHHAIGILRHESFQTADLRRWIFLLDGSHISVVLGWVFDDRRLRGATLVRLPLSGLRRGCAVVAAGSAALWAAAVAATPSTTVTRIFFISVGSLDLLGIDNFGKYFAEFATAFRMDTLSRSPSVSMLVRFRADPANRGRLGITATDPSFPVGRIISTSSSEGKQLPVYPLEYCIRCRMPPRGWRIFAIDSRCSFEVKRKN